MEQLLDPFVESSDLEHWHHTVVLRTLLLDNQHHLALLYMQVIFCIHHSRALFIGGISDSKTINC